MSNLLTFEVEPFEYELEFDEAFGEFAPELDEAEKAAARKSSRKSSNPRAKLTISMRPTTGFTTRPRTPIYTPSSLSALRFTPLAAVPATRPAESPKPPGPRPGDVPTQAVQPTGDAPARTVQPTSDAPATSPGSASTPASAPTAHDAASVQTLGFVVRGVALPVPARLQVTSFNDSFVHRFPGRNRRGRVVSEFIVHETVTHSVPDTVEVLRRRNLGVHLIMGPDGEITQHGDLADDRLGHAGPHNPASVGIEVVNPYYPRYLRSGLPWTRVIKAGWAHEGRYVVPTPQQAEAVAQLIGWITSPAAQGLAIPRTWIGLSNGKMAMNRVPGAELLRPGIYAHAYFGHADGAWLVLYAWLRIQKGRSPSTAYEEAIRLATTSQRYVSLP